MYRNKFIKLLYCFLLVVFFNIAHAYILRAPEIYEQIQYAINKSESGDTVSIWGPPPGQSQPPYTYYENIDFNGKNILVVNRSYIEDMGCPPSPNWVVIDGQQQGSVVTFNSDETHDAILRGFTIQHGNV